ncbi:hypothetical protein SynROS8604_03169 [Synechococcus sp. ROS8604]|nr:hypothetical protein SynROS8604_03169 [Synechococcus sp. ROS8604]
MNYFDQELTRWANPGLKLTDTQQPIRIHDLQKHTQSDHFRSAFHLIPGFFLSFPVSAS